MKKIILLLLLPLVMQVDGFAQNKNAYALPAMPDTAARMARLRRGWADLHESPPRLGVRDCFALLLDALDTRFLKPEEVEWILEKLQDRVITDSTARSYGNMYWGWLDHSNDVGDGNNVQFCVQSGILIKMFFNDRLSPKAKALLDHLMSYAQKGVRNLEVRVSYTNIYLMRIWNLVAIGQVYHQPATLEEGRKAFNTWLKHVSQYGNREYDSPTYSGVALESLLLLYEFSTDADIKAKATDAINFILTDLCTHYNQNGGYLAGAHSRDYNRVFSKDLLEEEFMNPLLGRANTNDYLYRQLCFSILKKIGLSAQQKELLNRKNRFMLQRWDSLPNTYACDFVGNKFSIASSNQAYSPDDKPFALYLSSQQIPEMPNIVYVMEGRDDHYGTWAAEGKGEKLKNLMPPNYPANGGWNKTRHLMPFMQSAQNKNEFVMLVSGEKDQNCINNYLNSTVILPNTFNEMWMGNKKISAPATGSKIAFDATNTFFGLFEDVAVAFRILWSNADKAGGPYLYNDGYKYVANRESFQLKHNEALRFTIQHPENGKGAIAMWWKAKEGIRTAEDFRLFREEVLKAPVTVSEQNGIVDVAVTTLSGKLGVKADLVNKKRLVYYNPEPITNPFLFKVDGVEIGKPIMEKYNR